MNTLEIYQILKNFQKWKKTTKEDRTILLEKEYIEFDADSKKTDFEWIKMPYKINQKWKDFLEEQETIFL